jgi:hypothetical protein
MFISTYHELDMIVLTNWFRYFVTTSIVIWLSNKYIGSTIYPLKFRLQQHEKAFAGHIRDPNKTRYCASFDILKENNYKIELLELNEYETRNELLEHEKYYIHQLVWIAHKGPIPDNMIILHDDSIELIDGYYRNWLCDLSLGDYSTNNKEYHFQKRINLS